VNYRIASIKMRVFIAKDYHLWGSRQDEIALTAYILGCLRSRLILPICSASVTPKRKKAPPKRGFSLTF
jgi:hypothetical protein